LIAGPIQVIQKWMGLSVMAGLDPAIHATSARFCELIQIYATLSII
jgi:hypothetical protein